MRLLSSCLVALTIFASIESQAAGPPRRVGILNFSNASDLRVAQFRQSLSALGYAEGENLTLVERHADGTSDRLPTLAAELVASNVEVILALGPAVWAARQVTTSVPVVIAFSGNPERMGLVASLAKPGGNLTGFSYMSADLSAKRLALLCEAVGKCSRVAVLYSPREPATVSELKEAEAGAGTLRVALHSMAVERPDELEKAFAEATEKGAQGVVVFTHGFAVLHRARIMELAAQHRVPVLYGWRDFVDEGGLMSYGPDIGILVKQAAAYVDRILKGEKPGDLPLQEPTRLELVVNLKTAKALGITLAPALLIRADEVIE